MKKLFTLAVITVTFIVAAPVVQAATYTFTANLLGLNENPPNASPASGIGSVVLDDVLLTITANESWSGLLAPATASHIHGPALPGFNAGVLFPLVGVPAATSGAIPQQIFPITPSQIMDLWQGKLYFNVHTSVFPGGEIRGQLLIPEPSSALTLAGFCFPALVGFIRRRRSVI